MTAYRVTAMDVMGVRFGRLQAQGWSVLSDVDVSKVFEAETPADARFAAYDELTQLGGHTREWRVDRVWEEPLTGLHEGSLCTLQLVPRSRRLASRPLTPLKFA